jgi:hypothetical protein
MANHKKAQHHHGKAGEAFQRGDAKMAAHHMGHALAALRSTSAESEPDDSDAMEATEGTDAPDNLMSKKAPSLRSRLAKFKK